MATIDERLARVERPRSDAGAWCKRLSFFAIPYFAIVVLGHRTGNIETIPVFWMLGVGVLILVAALALGVRGFLDLWNSGHEAGLNAAQGMFVAVLLLLPFLYFGGKSLLLPPLYDISTDLEDIPSFDTVLELRTQEMNAIVDPTDQIRDLQLRAYPKISARRYPLGEARVFKAVVELIAEKDWTILTTNTEQGNAPIDDEGSGLVAKPTAGADGLPLRLTLPNYRPVQRIQVTPSTDTFESQQISPVGRGGEEPDETQQERYVEAVASSFLFGFESDVVLRLIEEEEGTLVDMRSSSRWGPHDLGANASIIIDFMSELDTTLQGLGEGT
jgi:hypothetical protein